MLIQRVPWRQQPHHPCGINPKWGAKAVGYFLRNGSVCLAVNSPGVPIQVVDPISAFGSRAINTEGGCPPSDRFGSARTGSLLKAPIYLSTWLRPYTVIIRTPLIGYGTADNNYFLMQFVGSGYGAQLSTMENTTYRELRWLVSEAYAAKQSLTYQSTVDVPAKTYAFVWYGGSGLDLFADGELLQQSTGNVGGFGANWYGNGPQSIFGTIESYARAQATNVVAVLPYAATQQQLVQLAGNGVWDLLSP